MGRLGNNDAHSMVGYGGTDAWCSPRDVIDPLADFFGGRVDFDPCSNDHSIVPARREHSVGGLHVRWLGKGYENPPFSCTGIWTSKGLDEIYAGHCTELVRLVMYAPSTVWWSEQAGIVPYNAPNHPPMLKRPRWKYGTKRCLAPNPDIICTKRLAFIGDTAMGARFDTALVYYGKRHAEFLKAFRSITRWVTRGR